MDQIHKEGFAIVGQIALGDGLTLTVRGDCMRPVLLHGDVIRVSKRRFYLLGDILVFHGFEKTFTVHRFLGLVPAPNGCRYMTKADTADRPDGLVQPSVIIGNVTHIASRRVRLEITGGDRLHAVCMWSVFAVKTVLRHLRGSENRG